MAACSHPGRWGVISSQVECVGAGVGSALLGGRAVVRNGSMLAPWQVRHHRSASAPHPKPNLQLTKTVPVTLSSVLIHQGAHG
jgi:hypothetical protein